MVVGCPTCRRSIEVEKGDFGTNVGCPYCSQEIQLPKLSDPKPAVSPRRRKKRSVRVYLGGDISAEITVGVLMVLGVILIWLFSKHW